ncbi:MAG: putative kinase inhibitor protein [Methanoregula sp. PtaU1.Bin051]|nr:MAG: putative kinase inhibitor protein [Methanoregula sp. PtaU1.Bin051]
MEPLTIMLDFLEFPPDHTGDSVNRSPRIRIGGLKAESVAVMVFNPFMKTCCSFTPWIIWDLPAIPVIPAGIPNLGIVKAPVTAVQGTNDYGVIGYTGPNPPPGETHRYQFRVYGLDAMLHLPPGSTKHELVAAMQGHIRQYGETVAICSR